MTKPDVIVRIEFEDTETPTDQLPAPSASPQRPGFVLAGLGFVAVALVLALALLQPSEGETAAGVQREAAPAGDVTPTTSADPPTTTQLNPSVAFADPQVPITSTFDSITRRGELSDLFLALSTEVDGDEPVLFRSQRQGETWKRLPVNAPPLDFEGSSVWVEYSNLIEVGDGVAMLRTTRSVPRVRQTLTPEVTVERLRSLNGILWELDEEFEPLQLTGAVVPLFHSADGFGVGEELPPSSNDGSRCDGVVASVVSVSGDGVFTVPPPFSEPSQGHTVLEDGTIVWAASGSLGLPDSCEAQPTSVGTAVPPALTFLHPDGWLWLAELPADVQDSLGSGGLSDVQFGEVDGRVLLVAGDVAWAIDVERNEWELLADRRGSGARFGYELAPDGWLVEADLNEVRLTELLTGRVESIQGGPWGRWAKILYVDTEYVLGVSRTIDGPGESGSVNRVATPSR